MRPDDADLLERDRFGRGEAMPDRQHRLADDRERPVVEQVVRLGNRARERALDRENAVAGLGRRRPHPRRRGSPAAARAARTGRSAAAALAVCEPGGPGYATGGLKECLSVVGLVSRERDVTSRRLREERKRRLAHKGAPIEAEKARNCRASGARAHRPHGTTQRAASSMRSCALTAEPNSDVVALPPRSVVGDDSIAASIARMSAAA